MDLFAAILFLLLYFVRLHDWVPGLGGLNMVKPAMALGALGLMMREKRSPEWKFMNTPHEWVMVAFLLYGVYVDPDWFETLIGVVPFAGFYFLTAYALNTEQKLAKFFSWWCFCIMFMAGLGTITSAGIDITGADQIIVASMGRLVLNTWLMDNPNAFGHTMASGVALIYMMMVFRRDIGLRLLSIPLFGIVGMCVYGTQSKGAFITTAASLFSALLIGRKIWVQLSVGVALMVAGSAISSMMPRMANRDELRRDEGVMGRILAFEAARTAYQTAPVGWKRFEAEVTFQGINSAKATHSSYVQIGADLGPNGLFLYLTVLCCSLRSLFCFRTDSDDLERCRRLIFALTAGFAVSGWMIMRPYHAEYFLLAGAATAYHRLAIEKLRGIVPEFGGTSVIDRTLLDSRNVEQVVPLDICPPADTEELAPKRRFWNRYDAVDFGVAYAALYITIWCWDYAIENL